MHLYVCGARGDMYEEAQVWKSEGNFVGGSALSPPWCEFWALDSRCQICEENASSHCAFCWSSQLVLIGFET